MELNEIEAEAQDHDRGRDFDLLDPVTGKGLGITLRIAGPDICAAIRAAVAVGRLDLGTGFHCADLRVSSMRQMRDPDGETSHGVVTVEALVKELAP